MRKAIGIIVIALFVALAIVPSAQAMGSVGGGYQPEPPDQLQQPLTH